MNETNIWLDKADKEKLTKTAQKKQLSLSTYIDIIVERYYVISHENCFKDYIHKGNKQTHIKILNKAQLILTPTIITNCVFLYLHHDKHPHYEALKTLFEKLDRKVQSESDKRVDKFFMGNQIIRANYYLNGANK